MIRCGDGLGVHDDLPRAADEAVAAALAGLEGRPPDLVALFAAVGVAGDPERLDDLPGRVLAATGATHLLGCSAAGVIGGGRGVEDTTAVSVLAAVLPGIRLRTFHLEVLPGPDGVAVLGLPDLRPDERVGLLFADPYSFPVQEFVEGANKTLPDLSVVGGLATGSGGPASTRLFLDDRAHERGAVGGLFGGEVTARPVVSQGCRPVGPDMVVTRAESNLLLELAGRPALDRLREVVGGLAPGDRELFLGGPQLGIAMDEYAEEHRQGDFLIRPVLGLDPARAAVAVGDVVPVGRTVRFQVRDAQAADADLRDLLGPLGPAAGALLVSCNGRGRSMFPSADHDVDVVRELLGLPPGVGGVAGFFAGGEIGPVGGRNHLHGFTASVLTFGAG
jgi:small ligand-binding sensory domain FIST